VPELCRFFGIVIKMYSDDHPPPHFHAIYSKHEAVIRIDTMAPMAGRLPPRALGLVIEWATRYNHELDEAWRKAKNLESPGKIEPLD
jgi:hypothetical protein